MPTFRETSIIISQGDGLTIDSNAGTFRKQFPSTFNATGSRIGLLNCNLYYSWDNVTQEFNNLTGCSYRLNEVEYPVVFPPGFYDITQLNGFMEFTMRENGHYMVDDNEEPVFFLRFQTNAVYYRVTVVATPLPFGSLPTGWTNPNSIDLTGKSPQLLVSGSTRWGRLIGFEGGEYPDNPATVSTQVNGSLVPQITDISTILVHCSWVNENRFTEYGSVIGSFVPGTAYGTLLSHTPPVVTTYDASPKNFSSIQIRFTSQDGTPLKIKDATQTTITLLLEEPVLKE